MQELEGSTSPLIESSVKYPYQTEEYLLQVNDIVEVNVKTTDPDLNSLLMASTNDQVMNQMAGGQSVGDVFFMNGFTLDDNGKIELPLIGEVKLEGLTIEEAKLLVEDQVKKYVKEGEYFIDEQRFGPYALWHHKHFLKEIPGGVEMEDIVDYKLPMGILGQLVHPILVQPKLKEIFDYRQKKLIELFGAYN